MSRDVTAAYIELVKSVDGGKVREERVGKVDSIRISFHSILDDQYKSHIQSYKIIFHCLLVMCKLRIHRRGCDHYT